MTKIKDIIDIRSGYSDTVDIKNDFKMEEENKRRMATYRPIKSHREAFEIIAESPYIKDSKRCFILSGSYGTGKSHLGLIAANYFSIPSNIKEMESFFELYTEAEEEDKETNKKAQLLKNRRKEGKYLVCICDYINGSFESLVLRAIKEALIRENVDTDEINSIYKQALKKIEDWDESENQYFFNEFVRVLENEYNLWTLGKIKKELSEYNKDAINIFKDIHKKITTADFDYSSDNLVDIISGLSESKVIREKFRGIVILFDEFDYQLRNKRFELDTFQKFGQTCLDSFTNNFPIVFVATTHKSFTSYKNVYNEADFKTVSDRVKEIPMVTNGIEDIIGAVVVPRKESEGWQQEVLPNKNIFNQLATQCGDLGIFNWLSKPKLRNKIIENIYPMHPLSTYALLELAKDLGSNNRSVFKFFSSMKDEKGSYDWFVKNNDIINNKKELQLYTVDNLYNYFENTITTDNTELRNKIKDIVKNYETSLREYKRCIINPDNLTLKSEIYLKLLKMIVIFSMIDIPISFKNLKFGLNFTTENEEIELKNSLDTLAKYKIIFMNEQSHCYELKKSDALDVRELIKEKMEEENNVPINVFDEIKSIIKYKHIRKIKSFLKNNEFIEAKGYNLEYTEDKRFKIEFVTLKDAENKDLIENFLKIMRDENEKDGYEGIVINIICETADELKKAKNIATMNEYDNVIIAIPTEESGIFNDVFTLKVAINTDTNSFSSQDLLMLSDIISQHDDSLSRSLETYLDSKKVIYFGKDGCVLAQNNNDKYCAINKAMVRLFDNKRNIVKHEELNLSHKFKEKKDFALKEAVENILCISKDISFNTQKAADKGDTRYIRNVLHQYSLIKEYNKQGDLKICQVNVDLDSYKRNFPALADMIQTIKNSQGDINLLKFINKYVCEYGLGYNSVILFFSFILRYFKDNIMIIQDVNEVGSLKVETYDTVLDIIYYRKYRNSVIRYKEISKSQKLLVKGLYEIFSLNKNENSDNATIDELYNIMKDWYKNLNEINKVKEIYNDEIVSEFLHDFGRISYVNSHTFILEGIQRIFGYELDDLILDDDAKIIIEKCKVTKETVENGYYRIREKIFNELKKVFNSQAVTEDSLMSEIKQWYNGLTELQRNPNTNFQDLNSEVIVRSLKMDLSFEELFLRQLPGMSGYKLGNVEDWLVDNSDKFVQKIANSKKHIESICIVDEPIYEIEGEILNKNVSSSINTIDIDYKDEITVIIKAKDSHRYIYLTSNGSDPKKDNSQREEETQEIIYKSSENESLKFVSNDQEGRFSNVVTLNINNENKKYEVKVVERKEIAKQIEMKETEQDEEPIIKVEPKIEVILPKDGESLKRCFKSIIQTSKDNYKISSDEFKKVLQDLLNEV